ncbi:DUF3099 domain-containing protein [Pseudonocardia acaciae]|uniref:DUF3099 domain-containing protein n=1 Tax=Pseudonocardia acaciae TaxID=551276 RepID=UPI000562D788|nr:DUF3099 domain-containing protein [Pseudonocardia acaciae]
MKHPEPDDTPIVITDAARSHDDELTARRRRYSIMMGLRVPCLVLAALFYQTPWLAAGLIILSIPLPWMAVIIANDRLPIKRSGFRRYRGELEAPPQRSEERRGLDP